MNLRGLPLSLGIALTTWMARPAAADEIALEGGGLLSPYFVLSTGERPNAADEWDLGAKPTVRIEGWWRPSEDWSLGAVILPFYFRTEQMLAADLDIQDVTFAAGQDVRLTYQFHNARVTGAYRVLDRGPVELRLGASVIVRYASIDVRGPAMRERSTDWIVFPLVFLESRVRVSDSLDLLLRGDALPLTSIRLGLYDFLLAAEARRPTFGTRLSAGVRTFWGGYSPREEGRNNNEVFFVGPVLRALW